MNANELIQQILYIVITTVLPIAVAYLVNFIRSMIKKNAENIKNEKIRNLIGYAGDAISLSVSTVAQTYVDSLKASGNFSKEAQVIAKQMAIDKAKHLHRFCYHNIPIVIHIGEVLFVGTTIQATMIHDFNPIIILIELYWTIG